MNETMTVAIIVTCAGFLQGLTGFGFALIAIPLLSFFLPLKLIVPLVTMLGLSISTVLSVQLRRSIQMKDALHLLGASIPGILLGVYLLDKLPASFLSIMLGALMILFTTHQLITAPGSWKLHPSSTVAAGFLAGFLGGSIGAGGPPVILYTALKPWTKDHAKATLTFYFLLSGTGILISQGVAGLLNSAITEYYLYSLPSLAFGTISGIFIYKRVSDHNYRKLSFLIVLILGCVLVYRNLF